MKQTPNKHIKTFCSKCDLTTKHRLITYNRQTNCLIYRCLKNHKFYLGFYVNKGCVNLKLKPQRCRLTDQLIELLYNYKHLISSEVDCLSVSDYCYLYHPLAYLKYSKLLESIIEPKGFLENLSKLYYSLGDKTANQDWLETNQKIVAKLFKIRIKSWGYPRPFKK